MADEVQIRFGADIGGALSGLNALKQAIAAASAPVVQLKTAFAGASTAIQQYSSLARAAFQAELQGMVAARAIALDEALGLDIEYTARQSAEERARLAAVLDSGAATLAERSATYGDLVALSARYSAQLAQDQAHVAAVARREADRIARPYRQAFDEIGAGWRSAVIGLVEGTLSFRSAALRVAQSVERGFIAMAQTTLSRAAAGPLAALLGLAAPAAGEGVGDVLGNAAGSFLGGIGSFFGGIISFLGFARGGIVPSAAGGWALPNFPGMQPALLHAREMVLPASISEGLQSMIAHNGAGGGNAHFHFHGPADAPSIDRWFRTMMSRNPGVVRNMLRSNALTPRTI